MERKVLDLLLCHVVRIVRLEWHAVITHASGTVSAHFVVHATLDLSIFLV